MTPQIEKVKPAGVNKEAYRAEISGIDWPFIGSALDRTFSTIMTAYATMLPPQSVIVLCIRGLPVTIVRLRADC